MYIYKLGTECDGAQMRASDVYIPTLVALLGLCFDPSECFQDLCVWSRVVGNKSGKLRYVSRIMTTQQLPMGIYSDLPSHSPFLFCCLMGWQLTSQCWWAERSSVLWSQPLLSTLGQGVHYPVLSAHVKTSVKCSVHNKRTNSIRCSYLAWNARVQNIIKKCSTWQTQM